MKRESSRNFGGKIRQQQPPWAAQSQVKLQEGVGGTAGMDGPWLWLPSGKGDWDGAVTVAKARLTTSPQKTGREVGETHHWLWQEPTDPPEN